jgi:hypothetical protein
MISRFERRAFWTASAICNFSAEPQPVGNQIFMDRSSGILTFPNGERENSAHEFSGLRPIGATIMSP